MNKNAIRAVVAAVAAVPVVAIAGAGASQADTGLGPTTNSCAGNGVSQLPIAVADGVFIPDPAAANATGVNVSTVGTGSFDGPTPGQVVPGKGILVLTKGIGIGTLSGSYLRYGNVQCAVGGLFFVS